MVKSKEKKKFLTLMPRQEHTQTHTHTMFIEKKIIIKLIPTFGEGKLVVSTNRWIWAKLQPKLDFKMKTQLWRKWGTAFFLFPAHNVHTIHCKCAQLEYL